MDSIFYPGKCISFQSCFLDLMEGADSGEDSAVVALGQRGGQIAILKFQISQSASELSGEVAEREIIVRF